MKKRKYSFYIIIALFLVMQIYSISRINSLNHQLNNLENTLMHYQDSIVHITDGISTSVNSALEQQVSIIASCSYEIGNPDTEALTIPVTFRIQPKQLTDSTAVSLKFDNDIVAMERQGSEFILTYNFGLANSVSPTVIIEDKGVSQFEQNMNLFIYDLKSQIFPQKSPQFSGSRGYTGQKPNYNIKGSIYIDGYSPVAQCDNGVNVLTEAKYVVTLDGQVLSENEIDLSSPDLIYGIDIDESYKVESDQTLSLTVIAVDSLGFTHEYPLFVYNKEGVEEDIIEGEKITAPDGTVVFDDIHYY